MIGRDNFRDYFSTHYFYGSERIDFSKKDQVSQSKCGPRVQNSRPRSLETVTFCFPEEVDRTVTMLVVCEVFFVRVVSPTGPTRGVTLQMCVQGCREGVILVGLLSSRDTDVPSVPKTEMVILVSL